MCDVSVCIGCLATNVRMVSIYDGCLLKMYQTLTGSQDCEGLPLTVCFMCGAMLRKMLSFRARCHRAYVLLRDLYLDHGRITTENIEKLDINGRHKLLSTLSMSNVSHTIIDNVQRHSEGLKHERKVVESMESDGVEFLFFKEEFEQAASIKSEEATFSGPELLEFDSDDEPLATSAHSKRIDNNDGASVSGDFPDGIDNTLPTVKEDLENQHYIVTELSERDLVKSFESRQFSVDYESAQHKCVICYKTFNSGGRLERHKRLHEPGRGAHECVVCRVRVRSARGLEAHVARSHARQFVCTLCGRAFPNERFVQTHMKSHSEPASCRKKILKDIAVTAVKMTRAEQAKCLAALAASAEVREARYKCRLCYHVAASRAALDRHARKHDPKVSGAVECAVCKKRFTTRRAASRHHADDHSRRYHCRLCPHVSHTLKLAKSHYKNHASPRKRKVEKQVTQIKKTGNVSELEQTMKLVPLTQEQQVRIFEEGRGADAPFKCAVCRKGHHQETAFINHQLKHDPVSGKYECDICKYRYKRRLRVARHITYFHKYQYVCKICNKTFNDRTAATKHHLKHKGKKYECPVCGAQSGVLSTHLSHLRLKHPSDHVCGACGEAFVSQAGLKQHRRISHKITGDECPEPRSDGPYCAPCRTQFVSRQAWTRHVLISPKHLVQRDAISNGCRLCGETFATAEQLKTHRRAAHKARVQKPRPVRRVHKDIQCSQCTQVLTSANAYWQHFRREHPGETYTSQLEFSHVCEVCGKKFRCNALLREHRSVHTAERNARCGDCGRGFHTRLALRTHRASHSDERPHACTVCGKAFKLSNALRRHLKTHSGAKPYACDVCGKSFTDSSGRRAHRRNVHRDFAARAPP